MSLFRYWELPALLTRTGRLLARAEFCPPTPSCSSVVSFEMQRSTFLVLWIELLICTLFRISWFYISSRRLHVMTEFLVVLFTPQGELQGLVVVCYKAEGRGIEYR
jgi:hypothetical protein